MEKLSEKKLPVKDMVKFLREISGGFERGQIFYTALELDIFTLLQEPKMSGEISRHLKTSPELMEKLLDALVSIGILDFRNGKYVTSPSLSGFLIKGEPYYARYLESSLERKQYWTGLTKTLRNGAVRIEKMYEFKVDRDWVDYIARYSLLGRLQATVKIISGRQEFKEARRILDLGGCHGLFSIALAQENPAIEAVVFDRPGITDIAEEYIHAYEMQGRVRTMAGDFLKDDIGAGYDIVLGLCSIGGSREQAGSVYEKVAGSLNEGGLFVTSDFTLDDDGKGPFLTITWDIEELMSGGGHLHIKNKDLRDEFRRYGLHVDDIVDMHEILDVPMRLIMAKKIKCIKS